MSEPETGSDRPRKMAQLGRRQYDGIGPVTNDGMPIILRSVKEVPINWGISGVLRRFDTSIVPYPYPHAGGPGAASA